MYGQFRDYMGIYIEHDNCKFYWMFNYVLITYMYICDKILKF